MSLFLTGPLVALVAFVFVGLGVLIGVLRRPTIRIPHQVHDAVVAVHRHTRTWRLIGLLLGLAGALGFLVLGSAGLGRLAALTPIALGAGILLGTIWGELTARPGRGPTRSASLHTRRVSDYLGRGQRWTVASALALTTAVLAFGTLRGDADDQGRAGRALARECVVTTPDLGTVQLGSRTGPWPGSFYTLPLACGALVLLLLAVLALRSIVRRPAVDAASEALDTIVRRASAQNVLTACSVAAFLVAGPLALVMATMLGGESACGTTVERATGGVLLVAGALALGVGLALFGQLLIGPRIVVDDLQRPRPGGPAPVGAPTS